MKSQNRESSHSLRGKTDKSLKQERTKTDEHLKKRRRSVESLTTENIKVGRVTADKTRDRKRARVDANKKEHRRANPGAPSTKLDDQSLALERSVSDEAQAMEREKEDQLRAKERFQKKLISEALLNSEREDTDSRLSEERSSLDSTTREHADSHDKTKSALVTRDQFIAVVSHDLRNPLNAISLSAGILRRSLPPSQDASLNLLKHLDSIERNTANMDRMISDLLDVERMSNDQLTLRKEKVDICALLRECKELFAPVVASKEFRMSVETCPKPVYANVDRDRILQVLSNLIGNALKFTPKGGTIRLYAKKHAKKIEVFVADNGPGIPKNKRSLIFDRFSQLESADRRGLGLGLFISQWIVNAHKGRIKVKSVEGKGSTFSFILPLSASASGRESDFRLDERRG